MRKGRALRVCSVAGCPELVTGKGSLCPAHQKEKWDRYRTVVERPTAVERGYDAEWRRVRDAFIKENPLCVDCGRPATEVDHIIALKDGGTHDNMNLASRCTSCHSRKTARVDGGFGNRRPGVR